MSVEVEVVGGEGREWREAAASLPHSAQSLVGAHSLTHSLSGLLWTL